MSGYLYIGVSPSDYLGQNQTTTGPFGLRVVRWWVTYKSTRSHRNGYLILHDVFDAVVCHGTTLSGCV